MVIALIPFIGVILGEVKIFKIFMRQRRSDSSIQNEIKQLQEELKLLRTLMPLKPEPDKVEHHLESQPKLFRNRPNPFRKFTLIKYFVPEESSGRISLFIVDENGDQKIFLDYLKAGKQKLLIKDHALVPGIYFCSLVVDGRIIETLKMEMV